MDLQQYPLILKHYTPVTAALCVSLPLPPNSPVSIYFLLLSHAPPALFRNNAYKIPVQVENIKNAQIPLAANNSYILTTFIALSVSPNTMGVSTLNNPGLIISLNPALVTISTHYL
jgi:hypothetical protein